MARALNVYGVNTPCTLPNCTRVKRGGAPPDAPAVCTQGRPFSVGARMDFLCPFLTKSRSHCTGQAMPRTLLRPYSNLPHLPITHISP